MPQRLFPLLGRVDGDLQPCVDLALPDHLGHSLGTEFAIVVVSDGERRHLRAGSGIRLLQGRLLQDGFSGHNLGVL